MGLTGCMRFVVIYVSVIIPGYFPQIVRKLKDTKRILPAHCKRTIFLVLWSARETAGMTSSRFFRSRKHSMVGYSDSIFQGLEVIIKARNMGQAI